MFKWLIFVSSILFLWSSVFVQVLIFFFFSFFQTDNNGRQRWIYSKIYTRRCDRLELGGQQPLRSSQRWIKLKSLYLSLTIMNKVIYFMSIITLSAGFRIRWLYPLLKIKTLPYKILNCIWWWDSTSGNLSSIAITPCFNLTRCGSHC